MNGSNYEVRYSYDKLSRLTAEFNGKKDRKYVYTYDSSGNITSKKEYRWSDNDIGFAGGSTSKVLPFYCFRGNKSDPPWGAGRRV